MKSFGSGRKLSAGWAAGGPREADAGAEADAQAQARERAGTEAVSEAHRRLHTTFVARTPHADGFTLCCRMVEIDMPFYSATSNLRRYRYAMGGR